MPVVLSQVHNDRNEHWESLLLVGLEDVQEVIVLEEAHSSIGNLQVNATNRSHDSSEELVDKVVDLVNFANLQDLLQFSQEQGLLDRVGEWPILKQTFEEWDGKSSILGQEKHGASEQLFVEAGTSLHLVKWDDHILEENNVFVSKGHGETGNDRGENVEQLGGTIELVVLMDQGVEALVHGLSNHFSSGHEFSVQLVEDILQVVTLNGLL